MWKAKGQTKSVLNSEVSTLVKLGVAMGHTAHPSLSYRENQMGREKCPQWWGVHRVRFYCIVFVQRRLETSLSVMYLWEKFNMKHNAMKHSAAPITPLAPVIPVAPAAPISPYIRRYCPICLWQNTVGDHHFLSQFWIILGINTGYQNKGIVPFHILCTGCTVYLYY